MKISKQNHRSFSVSNTKKERETIKGHVYPNPIPDRYNEEKTEDIVSSAIGRIKRSKLYSIFSPCPEDANEQEKLAYGRIESNAKEIVDLLAARYDNIEVEKRLNAKVNALKGNHFRSVNRVKESSVKGYVNFCVDNCLKNSLRKVIYVKQDDGSDIEYYLPDLIKELLMITCVECNDDVYLERIRAYQNDKLVLVVKCLDEDVNKKEQSKQIVDSIDNQNVKVQVFDNGNGKILKLSGAEKKHAPLFRFMASYAAVDIRDKNLMLAKLRSYITLFIAGYSTYEEEAEIIECYKNQDGKLIVPRIQYIAELPENSAVFSEKAGSIISELYQFEAEKDKTVQYSDGNAAKDEPIRKKSKISLRNAYIKEVKNQLCKNFRKAKEELGDGDSDGKYWVTYIRDEAEKILCGKNINNKKIGQAYLITSIWKNMVAYIGTKYIDMGKAVYHFAMPENMMDLKNDRVFGEVRKEYESGITSFDYEMLRASEMIQRDVAVYLTFAINNFARNTVIPGYRDKEGNEDILTKGTKEKKEKKKKEKNESITENELYKDMKRRYLQFFGGQSKWEHSAVKQETTKEFDLFEITKELLYNLRNENFHYTGKRTEAFTNIDIIQGMFEYEISKSGSSLRKKYYSNNVLMFYAEENVTGLMDSLYNGSKYIPAQIPSFANILSREKVEQFLEGYVDKGGIGNLTDKKMYYNSIYFVLKEIYYYGFLKQNDLAERFKAAMGEYKTNHDEKWNWEAYRHFMIRVDEILQNKAASTVFHELCQRLITDFEQQNHNYKVRTSRTSEKDIYQHYKILLYLGIRNAFKEYLTSYVNDKNIAVYDFLKEPVYDNERFQAVCENEFCNEWKGCHLYDGFSKLKEDSYLLSWYVAAHFTDAKQVNHLMGDFKKHISFTEDIIRRREFLTGKQMDKTVLASLARKNDQYKQIVSMLEFVQGQTNVFSNKIKDYFEDEGDEYENVLANYVDFGDSKSGNSTLHDFCNKNVDKGSPTGTVGLFYDQEKQILNRNVVMASMFGSHDILAPNIKKITYGEICDYYAQMDALKEVFERNYCKTEDELVALRAYQNEKNRVELTDILIYSEIVNECLSKLIGWTYLRERDLMYFQLGVQYIRLYHTQSVGKEENWTRKLSAEGVSIQNGAILYEIVAMNDYNMPFFYKKDKKVGRMTSVTISGKVMPFVHTYGEDVYAKGLEFFEKYHKDYDDVVEFRNYIDHFKYFATTKRSILDLYSDAYDRLFDYSPNFRKSVTYVLENILLRYFAIGHIRVTQVENAYCYKKPPIARKAAKLEWKPFKNGLLISDKMTFSYKQEDEETGKAKKVNVTVYARSKLFMEQLAAILQYHK